jgi:hypothetical protein
MRQLKEDSKRETSQQRKADCQRNDRRTRRPRRYVPGLDPYNLTCHAGSIYSRAGERGGPFDAQTVGDPESQDRVTRLTREIQR